MQFNHETGSFDLNDAESALVGVPFGLGSWPGSDANGLLDAIGNTATVLRGLDANRDETIQRAAQKSGRDQAVYVQKLDEFQVALTAMADVVINHLAASAAMDAELAAIANSGL